MVTFAVSEVEAPRAPMPTLDRAKAVTSMLGANRVEQIWESTNDLVAATDVNALALAAHDAFYKHHPLVLSPDAVWFTLAQGFARHVALNAETLRHRFVKHEGKKRLVVVRPDFVLGQENAWPEVFTAFSDQIANHVGKLRDLVVADFSTTGPLERAACEVCVMDTFQAYFEYAVMCGCGIPSITLLGTPDDWKNVRRRASMLGEFGLESWTNVLLPVLDEIVRTSEGQVDVAFWRSFFHYESGSGPSELTGWILTLFPYLETHEKKLLANPYLDGWENAWSSAERRGRAKLVMPPNPFFGTEQGPPIGSLPSSLASAPVELVDARSGEKQPVRFVGGMFGVVQDAKTLALAPEFGWAVVHEAEAP